MSEETSNAQTVDRNYLKSRTPQQKAIQLVYGWAKSEGKDTNFNLDDVKIVWFTKTLLNWKAIVAIIGTSDNYLFEVTYNGTDGETYLDAYSKIDNVKFMDVDL